MWMDRVTETEMSVLWRVLMEMNQLGKVCVYVGYVLLHSEYPIHQFEKLQRFDLLLILVLYLKGQKTFLR